MYLTRKAIRKLPGKVMKTVPIPEPTIIEGFGCRGQIGGICKEQSFDTVLILTDKILTNLGYLESIEKSLSDEGIRYEIYDEINSEPKLEYIEAGRSMALRNEAKCIISLGGGSVMDTGKMIAAGCRLKYMPVDLYCRFGHMSNLQFHHLL